MAEDKLEVVEIKLDSKYLIVVPESVPVDTVIRLRDRINEWLENDAPFLILWNVKLVKVDTESKEGG